MPGILVYHQATYKLLGRRPVPSGLALACLDARERALGIALPRSVREWYAQEDATVILSGCREADEPYPVEKLGEPWGRDAASPDPAMLPFMADNHGGVAYALGLDGSDDPPVSARDDGGVWVRQADTSSRYLYILVWSALAELAPRSTGMPPARRASPSIWGSCAGSWIRSAPRCTPPRCSASGARTGT